MVTKRKPHGQGRMSPSDEVRRRRAIELLADGWGVQEVADELGVTRGAIWGMRDDEFDAEVLAAAERRTGQIERARLGVAALEVLADLMRSPKVPAVVRRQAASDLADRAGLAGAKKLDVKMGKSLAGLGDAELEDELLKLAEEIRGKRGGR